MSYQQYPMQQHQPQVPNPFQPKRKLDFVDGETGMRSFYVSPGEVVALFDMGSATMWLKAANEAGVPSVVRYRLTEEGQSIAGGDTESRLAAMERSIEEIKEALHATPVPDFRETGRQPRHAGSDAGQAGGQQGWLAGGGGQVADGQQPAVQAGGGQPLP